MIISQLSNQNTVMQAKPKSLWRVWMVLSVPPLLFLLVLIATSVYFGIMNGGDADAIAESVVRSTPYLLLVVQMILLVMFWVIVRVERLSLRNIGWHIGERQTVWREVLIGALPGLVLALLYLSVLSPLLSSAQLVFGDYVPPGELLPVLGSAVLPFFVANVVLAPFVEENIYRGYAITHMRERFSTVVIVVITCVFFGLLHWAGGFWYMLLTGIVAGGLFALLRVWRMNLVAPFSAHFILNLVEFAFVWLSLAS